MSEGQRKGIEDFAYTVWGGVWKERLEEECLNTYGCAFEEMNEVEATDLVIHMDGIRSQLRSAATA